MEISNNSNLNFRGRLNVSAMTSDIPYWKSVANLVKAKTEDCPKDVFSLSQDAEGIVLETTRKGSDTTHSFFWDNPSDLLRLGEEVLSDKFSKLMTVLKKQDDLYEATSDYLKKVQPMLEENEFVKLEEQAWDNAVGVGYQTNRIIENDEVLSKAIWDE